MTSSCDAVVVGSGPNGLAAAVTLAQAGRSVHVLEAADTFGGGLRSDELDSDVIRNRCAAVLPFAIGSPFLSNLPLDRHGLSWAHPEIPFTHPLDGGRVGVVHASLSETTSALGGDAPAYERLVGPLSDRWFDLATEVMQPIVHIPRSPITLGRYGLRGLGSVARLVKRFEADETRSILAGCAAHAVLPLDAARTGGFATVFCAAAHAKGWPVVAGGSQKLADALVSLATELGVTFEAGRRVSNLDDIPPHRALLFDLDPVQVESIAGGCLSGRYRRKLSSFRFGPGIFKMDHVLDGPVPWSDTFSRAAGTVHVGGTFEQVKAAEHIVASGQHPDQPFVLVAQQSLVDPSRTPDNREVLWSYTHVPNGSTVDMTTAIEDQIERFAPGFKDRIISRQTTTAAQLATYNANYVGGDINGGSFSGAQLIARPKLLAPYRTSSPKIFMCSASTPPGGGVHGMAGHRAGLVALRTALR